MGALGLADGMVRLVDHDPTWIDSFEREAERLLSLLNGLGVEVEHVGSTVVPGLVAKPIVDVAVGVKPEAEQVCLERLKAAYEYRGYAGTNGGHVFVKRNEQLRTHHVHVVPLGGEQWLAYLRFREILLTSEEARAAYSRDKRALVERYATQRKEYTAAKNMVVDRILSMANT